MSIPNVDGNATQAIADRSVPCTRGAPAKAGRMLAAFLLRYYVGAALVKNRVVLGMLTPSLKSFSSRSVPHDPRHASG